MLTEETNKKLNTAPANPEAEIANEESAPEEIGKGNWREAFRAAFDRTRRQQKPAESRQELGRDKSKSLFLLVGVCVALLLLFFGVFSHPKKKTALAAPCERDAARRGRHAVGNGAGPTGALFRRGHTEDLFALRTCGCAQRGGKGRGTSDWTQMDPSCRSDQSDEYSNSLIPWD